MKFTLLRRSAHHVIHFEEWPIDCLVRYLERKQRLLLTTTPKILSEISALCAGKQLHTGWLRELDDLFTSSVNRLVIQVTRQDQHLIPYINQLVVAMERELPVNINLFYVALECMESIKTDHSTQKKIFELINVLLKNTRIDRKPVVFPQLLSAIQGYEKELLYLMELQRQALFPRICLMTSRC